MSIPSGCVNCLSDSDHPDAICDECQRENMAKQKALNDLRSILRSTHTPGTKVDKAEERLDELADTLRDLRKIPR